METKWTEGPWEVVNGVHIRSAKDPIAKVWMMRNGEGKANANLLAAAPELYDALEKAIIYWYNDHFDEEYPYRIEWADEARAALTKARGE